MTAARRSVLAVVLAGGCAQPPAPTMPAPMLGATCTHVAATGGEVVHADAPPPYEAQRLVDAVAQLDTNGLDQAGLVDALRRLADAVAIVAPTEIADLEQIRHAADELRASHWMPRTSAQLVRMGLGGAVHALTTSRAFYSIDAERYRHAVTVFATALEAVDPDARLLGQSDRIVAALREATRAVFVAIGARPPFEVALR